MNIEELKKLAEAATPGPWKWDGEPSKYDEENEAPWLVDVKDSYPPVIGGTVKCSSAANAAYIAAANPAAILKLLAINAELVEALKLCAAVCAGEAPNKSSLICALEKSRAALAKAEGGEL